MEKKWRKIYTEDIKLYQLASEIIVGIKGAQPTS